MEKEEEDFRSLPLYVNYSQAPPTTESFLLRRRRALSSSNPSVYAMATDGDLHLPLGVLFGLSVRRRRQSSSDANLMNISNKLGADLLLEILVRLPDPKSAGRCKLVCPLWRSVISDPSFNRRYISHHQTMNAHDLKSMVLSFLPPMPREVGDALKVLDCNRDLVLCGFWGEICNDGERNRSHLVCNPFTKQWSALPLAPEKLVPYINPMTRLVFEPPETSPVYRFRVACMYQQAMRRNSIHLDVFCSESGEWTKNALVRDGHVRTRGLFPWNGELFWMYKEGSRNDLPTMMAVFNPFRLDMPPTSIHVPSALLAKPHWNMALSQGALHIIVKENKDPPLGLSVWRLEEDRKSWRKQCEGLVRKTSKCCNYKVEDVYLPFLHPQKPGIVFFNWANVYTDDNAVLCCDLTSGEVEFFAKLQGFPDIGTFSVFQPRVSSWSFTPIPQFENMHSESFLFNSSSECDPPTPSLKMRDAPDKVLLLRDSNDRLTRCVLRSHLRSRQQ